jgi:hypothetical protein
VTMATKEILELAIVADFDDKGVHAAYANLLSEQGNPHGELISIQMALEEAGRSANERQNLALREQELLREHGQMWLGELYQTFAAARTGNPPVIELRFSRGWIESIHVRRATYRLMERLARTPLARFLQRIEIDYGYEDPGGEWDPERQEMLPLPPIPEVTPAENEFYLPLREAPFLSSLRHLRIGETRGGESEPWIFFSSGRAELLASVLERTPRLEELHLLCSTRVAPRYDPASLFRIPLPNLRVLRAHNLFDHATKVLAANPSLGRLTHLQFHSHADDPCFDQRGPYLTLADLRNLLRSSHLGSLKHLQFRLSSIGDEGCQEIVQSGILRRLEVLDLRHGRVTDAGVRHLVASEDLRHLTWLELSRNEISRKGIALLRDSGVPFAAEGEHLPGDTHWLVEGDWE